MREQKNLQQENGKEHARTHMRRLSYVSTGFFYYFTMNSVDAYFIIFHKSRLKGEGTESETNRDRNTERAVVASCHIKFLQME